MLPGNVSLTPLKDTLSALLIGVPGKGLPKDALKKSRGEDLGIMAPSKIHCMPMQKKM